MPAQLILILFRQHARFDEQNCRLVFIAVANSKFDHKTMLASPSARLKWQSHRKWRRDWKTNRSDDKRWANHRHYRYRNDILRICVHYRRFCVQKWAFNEAVTKWVSIYRCHLKEKWVIPFRPIVDCRSKQFPSILLLNSKNEFHSFGDEARNNFALLEQNGGYSASQWLLFEKFKFQLFNVPVSGFLFFTFFEFLISCIFFAGNESRL